MTKVCTSCKQELPVEKFKWRNNSREKLWEEIAKCDVVCANCHAIRTATRRQLVEIEVM